MKQSNSLPKKILKLREVWESFLEGLILFVCYFFFFNSIPFFFFCHWLIIWLCSEIIIKKKKHNNRNIHSFHFIGTLCIYVYAFALRVVEKTGVDLVTEKDDMMATDSLQLAPVDTGQWSRRQALPASDQFGVLTERNREELHGCFVPTVEWTPLGSVTEYLILLSLYILFHFSVFSLVALHTVDLTTLIYIQIYLVTISEAKKQVSCPEQLGHKGSSLLLDLKRALTSMGRSNIRAFRMILLSGFICWRMIAEILLMFALSLLSGSLSLIPWCPGHQTKCKATSSGRLFRASLISVKMSAGLFPCYIRALIGAPPCCPWSTFRAEERGRSNCRHTAAPTPPFSESNELSVYILLQSLQEGQYALQNFWWPPQPLPSSFQGGILKLLGQSDQDFLEPEVGAFQASLPYQNSNLLKVPECGYHIYSWSVFAQKS
ncbi:hypothetical protein VP01_1446g2 [Puccinia sorghi]|uniref:Uncharacterized protein n=1 Tax=Puccinia sorghi TaxID=27349 RepID=A0A0L6VK50_9BASI|nr:hypothetical protein VP01_1446g2 [Puccinia sorghi]